MDWILSLVIALVGLLLNHAIKKPRDAERARLLTVLADDAAAVVLNLTPKAPWAQVLRDTIAKVATESTVPTRNPQKLESAATAALVRLGRSHADPVGK